MLILKINSIVNFLSFINILNINNIKNERNQSNNNNNNYSFVINYHMPSASFPPPSPKININKIIYSNYIK